MKFDNKTFQQKYEAWKNGADYWKDIRGINLGGDTQAEEPSPEEQQQIDQRVQSILNAYNSGKDVFTSDIAEDIKNPIPYDAPLNNEYPILNKYKGGKDDYINTFVSRIAPLVGQQLNRYGYKNDATFYNIMRQLAWESNYGRSRVARQQHNYGGVGWNGKTYTTYKNDADFVQNYIRLMHNRYRAALRAKTTQDYARALKQKGYYEDSLQNYTNGLIGMKSVVKASAAHRLNNKDKYNYNVKLDDVIQDYEDAKNASPIIINSPSIKQPDTINAVIPTTLLGPTEEQIKAEQYNKIRQQIFDQLTSPIPMPPAMQKMLQGNNKGKDGFGQKFWYRRGNNLHFKGGKDKRSFDDWANKASVYKGIRIKGDPTYDYKNWYNEDPNRAYALLNDDPNAHFDDKWKTPYHPTFSDQSVYSNAKHPGGTWGRFDYRDAYYAPLFSYVNPNDRIGYLNMAEDNGVVPFMNNGSMYRLDGDLYGGVLPVVQVIRKRGKK